MLDRKPSPILADGSWRRDRGDPSLADVYRSVKVAAAATPWRRAGAFVGPGYLVAVGYMDPGNWATSLAGGSKFGYTLLVVALVSNIMAIVLQSLCARLAIASGRDLAQACRDAFPPPRRAAPLGAGRDRDHRHRYRRGDRHRHRPQPHLRHPAGDRRAHHRARRVPDPLSAAARLPLGRGADHHAARRHRRHASPCRSRSPIRIGRRSSRASLRRRRSSPIRRCSIWRSGILGATVMPHNLYLHSGIVQTRAYGETPPRSGRRSNMPPSTPPSR